MSPVDPVLRGVPIGAVPGRVVRIGSVDIDENEHMKSFVFCEVDGIHLTLRNVRKVCPLVSLLLDNESNIIGIDQFFLVNGSFLPASSGSLCVP